MKRRRSSIPILPLLPLYPLNGAEAYEAIEAATVRSPGDCYLVVDFYSASDGEWSVTLEQPAA